VDQIALPYRIALGALLVVAALWFTVLKPGPVEAPEPAPTAPGATGLGNAVDGAKGAVATANAAGQATATADPTAEAAPAAGAQKDAAAAVVKPADGRPARAGQAPRDAAAPVLRDLARGRVVVLAFLGRGADERAVRASLQSVNRRDGRVVVRTENVRRVGRYTAITAGVKVTGTPTVLVLGKGPKAHTLTGLTTTRELDRAVVQMAERTRR
jgi:hypothetical protein